MESQSNSSFCSSLYVALKRCFVEVFFFCSAIAYIFFFPIFWLIKQCDPIANRWYSFFMSIIYLLGGDAIRSLREKTLGDLSNFKPRGNLNISNREGDIISNESGKSDDRNVENVQKYFDQPTIIQVESEPRSEPMK